MITQNFTFKDPLGLHLRPAQLLVSIFMKAKCSVTLGFKGKTVNGKSMTAVLTTGLKKDEVLTITLDGSDEQTVIDAVKAVAAKEGLFY